jgi:predicted DCC family thiol-disulfide oxidoreductase YuxK
MKIGIQNGWTGAQYSVFRFVLGATLLVQFARLIPRAQTGNAGVVLPLLVAAASAALLFALGWHDRIAAVVMVSGLAFLVWRPPVSILPLVVAGALLLVHACLPPAPFWSLAARGRVDPGGDWHLPPALFAAAWAVTSLGYAVRGWTRVEDPSLAGWLELLYLPLALFRRARPWIWTAMLVVHLARVATGFGDLSGMMVVLHFFTFDPAWIPRRSPRSVDTVLYDGTCGLCHRSVRFFLAEDGSGSAFMFAPLGNEQFDADSIVVKTTDGRLLMRSDAIVHLLQRLGGLWRILGVLFAIVPRTLRDAGYDFIARIRYRIFGRTKDACPLIPPDLRKRFTV